MKQTSQSWQVALSNIAAQAGSPVLTWLDADGERIELSGRVLENWMTKSVNFLIEDIGIDPPRILTVNAGVTWRTAIWVAAADSLGIRVELAGEGSAGGDDRIVVCLAQDAAANLGEATVIATSSIPLIRAIGDLPAGVWDGIGGVLAAPDVLMFPLDPEAGAILRSAGQGRAGHRELIEVGTDGRLALRKLFARWAGGGSAVLVGRRLAQRLTSAERAQLIETERVDVPCDCAADPRLD